MASVWLVPDGLDGERVDAAAARISGLSRSRVEALIAELDFGAAARWMVA